VFSSKYKNKNAEIGWTLRANRRRHDQDPADRNLAPANERPTSSSTKEEGALAKQHHLLPLPYKKEEGDLNKKVSERSRSSKDDRR
jgi:hypothetical protein